MRLAALASFAARHWLFLLLFGAGAVLRAFTQLAYRPALLNSVEYFQLAEDIRPPGVHPAGYPVFLRILPDEHGLWVVPAVQHVLGLGVAVLLYALLLRLGVHRALAALGSAAVLLDAYQLGIEQYVTPEALFELLLVGGCAALLWRWQPGPALAGLAGALFAAAALTRTIGVLVLVPAFLALLLQRVSWRSLVALVVPFAAILVAYAAWYQSERGDFALSGAEGRFLYGRVASFVDCSQFSKPPYEEPFCPEEPPGQRYPVNELLWAAAFSPFGVVEPPVGMTADEAAQDFARRAILHQPLDYLGAVTADVMRSFAPTRETVPGEFGEPPWDFHRRYPVFFRGSLCSPETFANIRGELSTLGEAVVADRKLGCATKAERMKKVLRRRDDRAYIDGSLASFLVRYQRIGYAPGPLLALGLLLSFAVALGLGRPIAPRLRWSALFFAAAAAVICLGSVFVTVTSWRYQIPQLVLLPPALALALSSLVHDGKRLKAWRQKAFGTIARRS